MRIGFRPIISRPTRLPADLRLLRERRSATAVPFFRRNVGITKFKTVVEKNGRIGDSNLRQDLPVVNFLPLHRSKHELFVLCDALGQRRFALEFEVEPEMHDIIIHSVQRLRTCYQPASEGMLRWSAHDEYAATERFRVDLGGLHPGEFILAEFVFQQRALIEQGWVIYLQMPIAPEKAKLYGPLRDRFFEPKAHHSRYHALALHKRRVAEALRIVQP